MKRGTYEHYHIIQIVPARPDQQVAYREQDGSFNHQPLVCWALVEHITLKIGTLEEVPGDGNHPRYRSVEGVSAEHPDDGGTDLASSASNFAGYCSAGDCRHSTEPDPGSTDPEVKEQAQ